MDLVYVISKVNFKAMDKKFFSDQLLYRVIPFQLMEAMSKYFRLQVEGMENVPGKGPAIIAPNHSGFSGFDAMILLHQIQKATGRVPRVLSHHLWFANRLTARPAEKLGFVKASIDNGLKILMKKQLLLIFPEGERGNFKPTTESYELRDFRSGFVRLAMRTGTPIVPALVLGAEETHINLKEFKLPRKWGGYILPVPLNLIPLPARWKIKILEPIVLPFDPRNASDHELVQEIADEIREKMQSAIKKELHNRKSVYL